MHLTYQSTSSDKPFTTAPEMPKGAFVIIQYLCTIYKGNDLFDRTSERPMKTSQAALSLTRTLNGGTLLKLQWSVHSKTATGGTIMKAQVPDSVNLDHFNELYIDERRVIVGRGGFQEAHGWNSGGAFNAANIFEELDSPNEWFLDKDTRMLYFMPNVVVAIQIPCLISVSGSSIENPVHNILIQGLILTQTSNNYMRD
jgi:hypothetical protein